MCVQAFLKTWNEACHVQSQDTTLNIPDRTFLLNPIKLSGPCVPVRINVQVIDLLQTWRTKQCFIQINKAYDSMEGN